MGASSPLTTDQQSAAATFAAWLAAPADGQPFVLSGYAGAGKTFLSMRFLAAAEGDGLCWTVVAPTHKALGVLRHHLEREGLRPAWHPSTIHRLLRLKLKRQGDREHCEETAQTAKALEHLNLVLVDEASMVNGELLEISLRCAHSFGTRLVFVGDPAQLPPVGETQSPVFALSRACRASLTHVVRHRGPVLRLAQGLREGDLPCQVPPPLAPIRSPEGMVALLDRQEWLTAAQEALRRSVVCDNPDLARILCYTNRTLEALVPIARRALHGEMADQLPVLPGEVLITRMAVMAPACGGGEEGAEEPDMVLSSNRELQVHDITPHSCDLTAFGVSGVDQLTTVIETLTAQVQAGDAQFSLRLLPPIGSQQRIALDGVLERLRRQARQAGKQEGRGLWRRFFLVRDAFASLGPAAVLTVHRSQGSTFSEVFVADDVFLPRDQELRRHLAYVAVSRASQAATLMAKSKDRADGWIWENWLRDREATAASD